ncbi:uncharacterized protein TRIADDRAFT_53636 [Trichoplax adhaerens]|uniref:Folate receptor-like domain-containing protein n=1 Tax=Trichoplax adhaerens TaxID=10228 RepID=B3RPR5_TRIAD|nr:hypothetical protein TRIADDRAFT_53636 [Trichoplax adhaerens]EDV28230.1 hypothetical protein TRIADDRAFT_53636 [Trichoplax adhaerens]|eukprot:XP_002110064.1 hypothetical protein TRIADDRAFT_53636 [Trichoplax adhaerens]
MAELRLASLLLLQAARAGRQVKCEVTVLTNTTTSIKYCPYFHNRLARPQSQLSSCSWFRNQSCCYQAEIDSIFTDNIPLFNVNDQCRQSLTYLMCYICAPDQKDFYADRRLTICDDMCQDLYDACINATYKGDPIYYWYRNGREFCQGRQFQVQSYQSGKCYSIKRYENLLNIYQTGHAKQFFTSAYFYPYLVIALLPSLFSTLSWSY